VLEQAMVDLPLLGAAKGGGFQVYLSAGAHNGICIKNFTGFASV
jgi:hypothetical protein